MTIKNQEKNFEMVKEKAQKAGEIGLTVFKEFQQLAKDFGLEQRKLHKEFLKNLGGLYSQTLDAIESELRPAKIEKKEKAEKKKEAEPSKVAKNTRKTAKKK